MAARKPLTEAASSRPALCVLLLGDPLIEAARRKSPNTRMCTKTGGAGSWDECSVQLRVCISAT
jgi:hypothetical protein